MIKLDGMEYNTCVAVSGEGDCVWTSSIVGNSGVFFGSSPSTPQHSESVPALTNTVSLKYNPSLYSIPSIASGSGSSASSTPKNSISGTGLRQSPKISLKLWSSVFGGLFDTTVAICQINAIPLFGHPNQIIER